ncbi:MAG TPA: YebC/PmpR family DNA-binding transcriptional regulator [Bacteroidales bacterium]|jgi:YebC/PmpR family DNA-binding regulatory protein|nr:YebC/PmpR family DNA-binding transcriptional regulator [Bacteroidales bacterium]
MSGHSKWSKIKRAKGANDAKRSKMFSKIVKEIAIAVKESGPDPEANPRLRLAINNAKGVNMPKDNVERAINKADKGGDSYEPMSFEGYAPHGIAVFVDCLTDNKNRTVSNIRAIFTKYNGSLGTNGSLSFVFDTKGIFTFPKSNSINLEEFELEMIDAGAEDIDIEEGVITVTTAKEDFGNVQKRLDALKIEIENAGLQRIPNDTKVLSVEEALRVLKMIDVFEDDDDVQNVYHSLELTDEIAEAME